MKYNPQIIRSKRKTVSLEIKPDGGLVVRAPFYVSDRKIEEFLNEKSVWIEKKFNLISEAKRNAAETEKLTDEEIRELAKRAVEYLPKRVEYYARLIGVDYGRITVRKQKTRWGSCSSKGNLNFNCLLMLTPPEVIDSVVVHELCHRKEMNHSKRFYDEILRVYPDYYKWNGWLKKNGSAIMRRAF